MLAVPNSGGGKPSRIKEFKVVMLLGQKISTAGTKHINVANKE